MTYASWGLAAALAGLAGWAQPVLAAVAGTRQAEAPRGVAEPPFFLSKPGERGCPPALSPNAEPVYPKKLLKKGVEGSVILDVVMDRCGFVRDAGIQKSSRHVELDKAALDAARQWRFSELQDAQRPDPDGLIRGPIAVRFENEYADSGYAEPAAWHAAWCDSMVPALPAYEEKAPRFIADPVPLTGAVASIVGSIPVSATYRPMVAREETYEVQRGRLHEIYRVATPASSVYPTVIRTRYVHDDARAMWVSSYVCEAGAETCASVKALVESEGSQWVHTWPEEYRERQYACPVPTAD